MQNENENMRELGQLIATVQDEVRAVRDQIDSLPSFPKGIALAHGSGQCPPQITKLQGQLSRFEAALKRKGEVLLQGIVQNYGSTTQELPYLKLPSIPLVAPGKGSQSQPVQ
jgi:hypothetical protein